MKANLDKIIAGCKKKKPKFQELLYGKYFSVMYAICMRYCKNEDEATEVLNDGFLKIFTKIDSYGDKGSFEGWMKRIMVNTALDQLKKNKSYYQNTIHSDEIFTTTDNYISNEGFESLKQDDILVLIRELPPMTQSVFNMYIIDGYKHTEIAEQLNISTGTSQWHLNNARKILKQSLEKLRVKEVNN